MKVIQGYLEVDINKLKPDPNQPRKYFDAEAISSIAATIKSNLANDRVGLVNPIEIDKDYVIVTGETRWRGAKEAGELTVPCKMIELDSGERFFRQFVENLARNSMTPLENAEALRKILIKMGWKDQEPGSKSFQENYGQEFKERLAKKIGKTVRWINQMLEYLNEEQRIKDYLKTKEAKASIIREINQSAPSEFKDKLKNKLLEGSLNDRETTNELIRALKWSKPQDQQKLLEEKYDEKRSPQNILKIHDISPEPGRTWEEKQNNNSILKHLMSLSILIDKINVRKMNSEEKRKAIKSAEGLINSLNEFIDSLTDTEPKLIS